MRALLTLSLLLTAAQAQSTCPNVHFKNAPTANLTPSTTTRLNLVRQADGSYTSYETSNGSPYTLLSTAPHFEKQLTQCLPATTPAQRRSPTPANPAGSPSQSQAIALLSTGNYLVVSINFISGGIDATIFDPQMNQLSVANYKIGGSLALGDFNGDGNLDIASVTNGSMRSPGQLMILLGNGGSSFQQPAAYSIGTNLTTLNSFAIGDLNGDHKLDIAVAVWPFGAQSGSIMTFLGNGDGTFTPGPSLALTQVPMSVALADLDGDGKLDLAVSLGGNIAFALGKGDGSFAPPSYIVGVSTNRSSSIAVGDMNGDSIPDIVTPGTILFGDGKGAFPKRQDYVVPEFNTASPGSVILTDFNNDGQMDIVLTGGTPALMTGIYGTSIIVLFGQRDGTFFAPRVSIAPGLGVTNAFFTDLRAADFNADGIPDLAFAGLFGIGAMLGTGDGTFVSSFAPSIPAGWYLATGDFNMDGNQDIVAVLPYPPGKQILSFFAGKGDGTFQTQLNMVIPPGAAALVSGDFNGDGKLDVAVLLSVQQSGDTDSLIVYLGNGDGSFRQGATYPAGPVPSWMVGGDLNNDGKLDLVIASAGAGNVVTLLGKGDGTFAPAAPVQLPVRNSEGSSGTMSLADFNHDGKLDLAVTTVPGFAILLGKGDGTFQPPVNNSLPTTSLAAVDLDNDGVPDLITLSQVNNVTLQGLYSLVGNGDGSFQPEVSLNIPGGSLVVADVNRDGKPDLVSSLLPLGFFSLLNLTNGPPPFKVVSSASFALAPVAPNSFVSAVGANLPASLTGLAIQVTDSAGVTRAATPLYASPTQINFLMPDSMSAGVATVGITSPLNALTLVAPVDIVAVAPGLFVENTAGVAAAYAIRVDAQGKQTVLPVFTSQSGVVTATPIDLGVSTDQVYLILFGTGFDTAASAIVNVTVAGKNVQAPYSGPQGLPGLDQVNVLLPHSLAGSGNVAVVLSANGAVANTVHVTIQ